MQYIVSYTKDKSIYVSITGLNTNPWVSFFNIWMMEIYMLPGTDYAI